MKGSDENDNDAQDDSECFKNFFLKPNDPHSIDGLISYQITQICANEKAICRWAMASLVLAY